MEKDVNATRKSTPELLLNTRKGDVFYWRDGKKAVVEKPFSKVWSESTGFVIKFQDKNGVHHTWQELRDAGYLEYMDFMHPEMVFYVAECMEFPHMGEYHSELASLRKAYELYDDIPSTRRNGIKGIGFILRDGSLYDDMDYSLFVQGKSATEDIDLIPHYKNHEGVQKAMQMCEMWSKKKRRFYTGGARDED